MTNQKPTLNQADIRLLRKVFATKEELKPLATKDDLKRFATKDDLKPLATKEELKPLATKKQLDHAVTTILNHLEQNYATKQDLEDLKQHINNLPTREEFFNRMDKVSQDYQTFIQEKAAILSRLDDVLAVKTN